MNPRIGLRITAVVFLLFAVGHTVGFLTFRPPTAEGQAVFASMNAVHFAVGSATFSYGNFYRGFGLSITASQLFLAWLTWILAGAPPTAPNRAIVWAICVLQIIGIALSLAFFSAPPAVFSAIAAILLALSAQAMKLRAATS